MPRGATHARWNPSDATLQKLNDLRAESLAERLKQNTAYSCVVCGCAIKRNESYMSYKSGVAHMRCVRDSQ